MNKDSLTPIRKAALLEEFPFLKELEYDIDSLTNIRVARCDEHLLDNIPTTVGLARNDVPDTLIGTAAWVITPDAIHRVRGLNLHACNGRSTSRSGCTILDTLYGHKCVHTFQYIVWSHVDGLGAQITWDATIYKPPHDRDEVDALIDQAFLIHKMRG